MRIFKALALALLIGGPAPVATQHARVEEPSRLSELLGSGDDSGFAKVLEPRRFDFPQDHGPHPAYRNEWWYLTGNLDADDGRRFGFELTFFRFALTPAMHSSDSNWRSNQVYIAHLAVTDAAGETFYVAQRYSRGSLGLSGAQADPFKVWIDDWEVAAVSSDEREQWRLRAGEQAFGLELSLTALKPPIRNGKDGLSQKSAEPGNASYYYSITRWDTAGRLRTGDRTFDVSGLSWLDREWSSSALAAEQQGWDWFALQLSDGSELMFYNLRLNDGEQDPHSAGTWISASGETRRIDRTEIHILVTDRWESPSGGSYPAAWTIRLPQESLTLRVEPVMKNQELNTTVRYWEGAVDVSGERGETAIGGRGYVELTGYAE